MNRFLAYLRGYLTITFCGASPQWTLNLLSQQGVPFWNAVWHDSFTVSICVAGKRASEVQQCVAKSMCEIISVQKHGLANDAGGLLHRPVLLVFSAAALLVLLVLPQFVLFYQVVGNETIADEQILYALDEIGIGFGIPGMEIDPQWIKNHILGMIPDLEWITVTQNGCRAQVVVRERTHKPETTSRKGLSNVVASQSGLITEQSVLAGQAMVQVGDTVAKGDLLVSGIVDLERTYTVVKAEAEIYARTWRNLTAVTPNQAGEKQYTGDSSRCVWLELGEKRIKIYGNSGISSGMCDKIISKSKLELPGGLTFPVSVIVETCSEYTLAPADVSEDDAFALLKSYLRRKTETDMVAGLVLVENYDIRLDDGRYQMAAALECHEMIASVVDANWEQEEFFHDREIRERGTDGTDH